MKIWCLSSRGISQYQPVGSNTIKDTLQVLPGHTEREQRCLKLALELPFDCFGSQYFKKVIISTFETSHSYNNFSYFTFSWLLRSRHPRGGSFIRPNKANFGVDFLAAVKDRYGLSDEKGVQHGTENTLVFGKKAVEFVGLDSIAQLQRQV